MKNKYLSILAILSATAAVSVQAACNAHKADIDDNGKGAYVINSEAKVVRDSWGGCVRTNYWTVETSIAQCEGVKEKVEVIIEEPKAAPVVAPKPAPVVEAAPIVVKPAPIVPAPVIAPVVAKPAPVVASKPAPTLANFRGLFANNSAELKSSANVKLDEFANFMTANPLKKIVVTGHTDSVGSEKHNQILSEKRANSVKTYLESKGISSYRINAMGAGESTPVADNTSAEGRAKNRRVAVDLVK